MQHVWRAGASLCPHLLLIFVGKGSLVATEPPLEAAALHKSHHRITERLWLDRTLKIIQFHPHCHGQGCHPLGQMATIFLGRPDISHPHWNCAHWSKCWKTKQNRSSWVCFYQRAKTPKPCFFAFKSPPHVSPLTTICEEEFPANDFGTN